MRLVSAGISTAIALTGALVFAAPSLAAGPVGLGEPVTPVVQPLTGAAPALPATPDAVRQALPAAPVAAESVRQAVQGAVAPRSGGSDRGRGAPPPPTPDPATVDRVAADPVTAVQTATSELSRRAPVHPSPRDLQPPALGDALRAVGQTLRGLVPVDLPAPLSGRPALTQLTDAVLGALAPFDAPAAAAPAVRPPVRGSHDLLAAGARPAAPATARPPRLAPLKSASVQPPAAEAGGRPGSPSPRKAHVSAGGTAAPAPSGFSFAPFLGLLVLAALALPRLLRRLDAAPAFLRPALFVCALERPG